MSHLRSLNFAPFLNILSISNAWKYQYQPCDDWYVFFPWSTLIANVSAIVLIACAWKRFEDFPIFRCESGPAAQSGLSVMIDVSNSYPTPGPQSLHRWTAHGNTKPPRRPFSPRSFKFYPRFILSSFTPFPHLATWSCKRRQVWRRWVWHWRVLRRGCIVGGSCGS